MQRIETGRIESFKQYAADCLRQAADQETPADRDILLNVAKAWVRLAQLSEAIGEPAADAELEAGAAAAPQGGKPTLSS